MEMDAFRDPAVVELLLKVGCADERGRLGNENADVSHLSKVVEVFERVQAVKFADVFPDGEMNPDKIKEGMRRARVQAAA